MILQGYSFRRWEAAPVCVRRGLRVRWWASARRRSIRKVLPRPPQARKRVGAYGLDQKLFRHGHTLQAYSQHVWAGPARPLECEV
jgi:hypothetical protein